MKVTRFSMPNSGAPRVALPAEWDDPATLVLVFAGGSTTQTTSIPAEVLAAFGSSVVVGCSTAGGIGGDQVSDDSVVAAVVHFERSEVAAASASLPSRHDSYDAGRSLADQLLTRSRPLRAVLVFAPGMDVNGSDLARGLTDILPPDVLVTGGLAGDGVRFGATWVLADGELKPDCAVAVGLYGEALRLGHGSGGGWEPFGPERVITSSHGNVLTELDGRPALALYRQYLGDLAVDLPGSGLRFPLAIRESGAAERTLTRTLLAVDEGAMTMTFAGDVPQGWLAQLMGAGSTDLLEGASEAADQATLAGDSQVLALAISCVGRRMVLGESAEEELERTLESLPPDTVQIGFYSYGELSPSGSGVCELHNQTMTLTTITEA